MNREHLSKIVNSTLGGLKHEHFEDLFEPLYKTLQFKEQQINTCLRFNYKEHDMIYKSGELSCTGLVLHFVHPRFKDIYVNVVYGCCCREIYNSVLAIPEYTESDWKGKRNIAQEANKITSDNELSNYFKRLYKRFECPILY